MYKIPPKNLHALTVQEVKLISHRGNIGGADPLNENAPLYVDAALGAGYDVEVDLWQVENTFFLGHDAPQYEVNFSWLVDRSARLWIHCKNVYALQFCQSFERLHYFWHQSDHYTITSEGVIWAYPTSTPISKSIIAVPEVFQGKEGTLATIKYGMIWGICTDYGEYYRDKLRGQVTFT